MDKLKLPKVKLDLGSGNINMRQPIDEWIRVDALPLANVDVICDFADMPFNNGIADEIWSGDSLEHVQPLNYPSTLTEWSRVLKVGGTLGLSTPNLHSTMIRYASGDLSMRDAHGALYGEPLKEFHQHYNTFTVQSLQELLSQFGFGEFDFSGSPGNPDPHNSWWIVCSCKKIKDL